MLRRKRTDPINTWPGNDRNEWFPVKITGTVAAGGSLNLSREGYTADEVWIDAVGDVATVEGGRYLGTNNPGVPLDSTTTFAVDDIALARMAPGAGGLLWELQAYPAGEETICFQVVTAVTCNAGTLSVTTKYIHITGRGLSVTVDDTAC